MPVVDGKCTPKEAEIALVTPVLAPGISQNSSDAVLKTPPWFIFITYVKVKVSSSFHTPKQQGKSFPFELLAGLSFSAV